MKKLLIALALAALANAAAAQPDCRRGVDHKVGCGPARVDQYQRDHYYNSQQRRHHPQRHHLHRNYNSDWVLPAIILGGIVAYEVNRNQQYVPVERQPEPVQYPTYQYIEAYDPSCACYKEVLIQVK